ncbi:GNAT family N-acetyltransferase [Kineosporia mesophila]|uniref:GNAT family N-acetyltransferase n=1 Tax=Kineosporia mesophila TaxID=566012 RepID=A0ABP6Z8Y5_9ACTN|nr:GNAT family N-acetyltransferase [Kineosporia mesophila]
MGPRGSFPTVRDVTWIFSPETARIDRDLVHGWLSKQAYWALGRTRAAQDTAIDASRNYGVYDERGAQVAYARVVTDGATFAWLCDVFVDPGVRGRGAGKMLVAGVLEDLDALGLPRTFLGTADAHGLYARYGFAPADPSRFMLRVPSAP